LRAYSTELLQAMPYEKFSNDFVFDSQIIAWAVANGFHIDEVNTECYYTEEVSSIGFMPSLRYGIATLGVIWQFKCGYFRKQK